MLTQSGACTEKRLPLPVTKVIRFHRVAKNRQAELFSVRKSLHTKQIAHPWRYLSKLLNRQSLQYDSSGLELGEMSFTRAARGLTQPAQQSSFVFAEESEGVSGTRSRLGRATVVKVYMNTEADRLSIQTRAFVGITASIGVVVLGFAFFHWQS